jgi:hypothetical protein
MRRRVPLTNLNPRDHRAPVPSGAGMGAAAVLNLPSPVSRAEEEAKAHIWRPIPEDRLKDLPDGTAIECTLSIATGKTSYAVMTPATDPTANAPKKAGWPKGKKRGPRHAN